jgi:hypothetical protein
MGVPDSSVTTPDTVMVWAFTGDAKAKKARHIRHSNRNGLRTLSHAEPARHSFGKYGLFFFIMIDVLVRYVIVG